MILTRLSPEAAKAALAALHSDWQVDSGAGQISRTFAFNGIAKAAQLANLAVWYAEKTGHHPDIAFGWGYCRLTYTTHDSGGLTEADFAAAAGFDRLVAG